MNGSEQKIALVVLYATIFFVAAIFSTSAQDYSATAYDPTLGSTGFSYLTVLSIDGFGEANVIIDTGSNELVVYNRSSTINSEFNASKYFEVCLNLRVDSTLVQFQVQFPENCTITPSLVSLFGNTTTTGSNASVSTTQTDGGANSSAVLVSQAVIDVTKSQFFATQNGILHDWFASDGIFGLSYPTTVGSLTAFQTLIRNATILQQERDNITSVGSGNLVFGLDFERELNPLSALPADATVTVVADSAESFASYSDASPPSSSLSSAAEARSSSSAVVGPPKSSLLLLGSDTHSATAAGKEEEQFGAHNPGVFQSSGKVGDIATTTTNAFISSKNPSKDYHTTDHQYLRSSTVELLEKSFDKVVEQAKETQTYRRKKEQKEKNERKDGEITVAVTHMARALQSSSDNNSSSSQGQPGGVITNNRGSMQLGASSLLYQESTSWLAQPLANPTLHQLFIEDLSFCGQKILTNFSSNWQVTVDTGASCLTLPQEIYDTFTAWFQNGTTIVTNDTVLPAFSFFLSTGSYFGSYLDEIVNTASGRQLFVPLGALIINSSAISDLEQGAPSIQVQGLGEQRLCILRGSNIISTVDRTYATPAPKIVFGSLALSSVYFAADFTAGSVGLANKLDSSQANTFNSFTSVAGNNPFCAPISQCQGEQTFNNYTNTCEEPDCTDYFFFALDKDTHECIYRTDYFIAGMFMVIFIAFGEIMSFFVTQYTTAQSIGRQILTVEYGHLPQNPAPVGAEIDGNRAPGGDTAAGTPTCSPDWWRRICSYSWISRMNRTNFGTLQPFSTIKTVDPVTYYVGMVLSVFVDFALLYILKWVSTSNTTENAEGGAGIGEGRRREPRRRGRGGERRYSDPQEEEQQEEELEGGEESGGGGEGGVELRRRNRGETERERERERGGERGGARSRERRERERGRDGHRHHHHRSRSRGSLGSAGSAANGQSDGRESEEPREGGLSRERVRDREMDREERHRERQRERARERVRERYNFQPGSSSADTTPSPDENDSEFGRDEEQEGGGGRERGGARRGGRGRGSVGAATAGGTALYGVVPRGGSGIGRVGGVSHSAPAATAVAAAAGRGESKSIERGDSAAAHATSAAAPAFAATATGGENHDDVDEVDEMEFANSRTALRNSASRDSSD